MYNSQNPNSQIFLTGAPGKNCRELLPNSNSGCATGTAVLLNISKWIALFALLSSSLLPTKSWALSGDSNLPAQFSADHISHNIKSNITIFTGHVQMDQGSTHLTADKVTAYKDKSGQINKILAEGKPAHYSTLPDAQQQVMDAYGKTIIYFPLARKAEIIGEAKIIQAPNSYSGAHLVYDMAKQLTTALPSEDGTSSQLILQPQNLPGRSRN